MNESEEHIIDELFRKIIYRDDEEAFRILFYKLFSPLCLFAYRYIQDKKTCEDIVQDTFFKLWNNRKDLEINSSSKNYIITNVRNRCLNYLQREEVKKNWEQHIEKSSHIGSVNEIYHEVEIHELMTKALGKLPVEVKAVFEMSRFGGKTYNEIAQELNISVKTVEAYVSKALKQLRVDLKDYLT